MVECGKEVAWGGCNSRPQPVPMGRPSRTLGARLFTAVPGGWRRGSGHKLKEERFRPLDFFSLRAVRHWSR